MNWLSRIFKTSTESTEPQANKEFEPSVVWLHGANQTSLSFAYLRSKCNFKNEILINYSSMNRFYDNLDTIVSDLKNAGPIFVIGHSLGGLYGLHLTQHLNVIGGVSISTPFRGSSTADWAKYIVPQYPLFRDIGRKAPPVQEANKIELKIPWTQVVSTSGSVPYHSGPNDGVVTVASMTHRSDMKFVEFPHTHYEVVCSDAVAELVKNCYAECQSHENS